MSDDNPTWEIFVEGTPAPGGSKSFIPIWHKNGTIRQVLKGKRWWPIINVIDSGGERNAVWRKTVAWIARAFMMRSKPFDVPFHCGFTFFLRRPNDHYGTGRNAMILKPDAPAYHTHPPDALKLARATEDALTGIVWLDDAQVIHQTAEKRWAARGTEKTGCIIRLTPLIPTKRPPAQQTLL